MLLVSALLIGVACLGLTVLVALQAVRRERALRELEVAAARHRAEVAERRLFVQSREDLLLDAADAGSAALTRPAEITRATHQGIAAIPFGILEQIPAAAERTKAVREIHDEISQGVYQAISGTTRGIAGLVRGGLGGTPSPRPRPLPTAEPPPALEATDAPPALEASDAPPALEPPRPRPRPRR
jgi:hypothetical protein